MKSVFFVLALLFLSYASCKWLPTPRGRMVWHECTIEVPVDSRVVDDPENAEIIIHLPDGSVKKHPRCTRHYEKEKIEKRAPQEEAEGWQVWTQYNAIQNKTFTSMTNYFTVPTSPPSWSEIPGVGILYIFPGLQNDDWVPVPPNTNNAPPGFDIIQPVLQYGSGSANGGGKNWEVANWYVTLDDSAVWTPSTLVDDGDLIYGIMTQTDSQTWYIGAQFPKTGELNGFSVTRPRLAVQNWAFVTLEVYNVGTCNHFPQNTASNFTKIILLNDQGKPEMPVWDSFDGINVCNTGTTVYDPSTVAITFP